MMTYQEAKSNKQAAMSALNNAETAFETAKGDLQSAKADVDIAYENLTQKMAEKEAGDATQTDVSNAKTAYQDAKADVDDARVTVDAKAKAIQVFTNKKEDATQDFKELAFEHFKDQAEPLAGDMIDALTNLRTVNDEVKAFRDQVTAAGLSATKFMVPNFEKIKLPIKHQKYGYTIEKWQDEMNQKLQNLKS